MKKNKQPLTIEQQHEIYEYIQEKKKQDREKKKRELISLINHWDDLAFCNLVGREGFIKNRDKFIDMYIEEFGKDDYYDWFMELKKLIGKK